MGKARIDIVGSAAGFLNAIRQSRTGTRELSGDLSKLALSARKTGTVQVAAAVKADERLRQQIRTYRELAATAEKGSREQVAATNLADRAERRLARSLTVTAHEAARLNRSSSTFGHTIDREARHGEKSLSRLSRGFAGLGFGLLAGGSLVYGIKNIVDVGVQASAALGQLRQAEKDVGDQSVDTNRQVERQLETQRRLGFDNLDSTKSLSLLERATRKVALARSAQILADNISRGRHVALAAASNAVARAYGGQTTALRRLVPFIAKGATATEAIAQAQKAYGGSAERYANSAAGAQAHLGATIESTVEVADQALLPTITKLSNSVADWLGKTKNQERLQRDVTAGMHDLATVAKTLLAIIRALSPPVRAVSHALGGTDTTIKLLTATIIAFKVQSLLLGLAGITTAADLSSASLAKVLTRVRLLSKLSVAPIIITVEIIYLRKFAKNIKDLQARELEAQTRALDGGKPLADTKFANLIKREGERYNELRKKGVKAADAIAMLKKQLGGGLQADDIVAAAINYAAGGPEKKKVDATLAKTNRRTVRTRKPGARDTSPSLTPDQQNQLDLATAKTDAQKLKALVEERKLLAAKIASIRRQLKTAKGAQADLLIADLQTAEQADTSAWEEIHTITQRAAAKKKSAAAKAAAAARKAAHDYASRVATTAQELANAANSASAIATTRAAYRKLIAYYKREAHDERLTEAQRARYAADAIAARRHLVQQIVKEQRAMAKATETKQLSSLGVGKGQSIGQLLQRIKDAASAKEQGLESSGRLGTPTVRALRDEARQVSQALKGTYLDTDLSRNVLTKIRHLLSGQLGKLNADMRGKIHQLLQGLKGDLTEFDGFNLTAAEKRRRSLDRRFADRYRGGHSRPRVGSSSSSAQGPVYHWHYEPHIVAIANEPLSRALERGYFKMRAAMGTGA